MGLPRHNRLVAADIKKGDRRLQQITLENDFCMWY